MSLLVSLVVVLAVVVSALTVQPAKADNLYARIQGVVTDPSGAVLAGTKLTATNLGTNISYDSESKSDGGFVFLNLPIGTYKVTATNAGFRTFTQTGITLVLDQVYALNIKMELGQISEQVVVEANNVQVETVNTQLGTVINGDVIRDMPLIGRNFINLQQLEPGVVASSDRFGTFATNGSQSQQNSFLIMGQDANDLPLNTPIIIPNPDAIGEFNMVTDTINPEYGRNSGAIINASIRSGTNSFHGDAFEFYRDTFLNTKDFFQKNPSVFHQNQFGGTIGGPIYKNHTFFFYSYQGTRARQAQGFSVPHVFTQAERGGDFSADGLQTSKGSSPFPLFGDSASTCPVSGGVKCAANTKYSALFSTGVIPSQDLNTIATNLTSQFVPLPNLGTNQFTFSPVTSTHADQHIWRVDHTFGPKDTITVYGYWQRNPSSDTLPFTGATVPGFGEHAKRHYNQHTAGWTHTFSSNALNEIRFGYTRFNFDAVEPNTPVLPSSVGFGITPQDGAVAGLPVISVNGLFTLGFSANGPQPRIDQTFQLDDNFSLVIGRHTLKFGVDSRRFQVANPFFFENSGSYGFNGSGAFSTGVPGADFLMGIPDTYSQSSGSFIDARAYGHYFYMQDSWKAASNFTVNYGLGWQINTPTTDHFNNARAINCFRPGQQSAIYPTAPAGLVFPGDAGCTSSGYKTGFTHFGPRLGVAWSPNLGWLSGGPGKFSIRAGAGVFFNQVEEELTLQNLLAPPFALISAGASDFPLLGSPSFANPYTDISTGASIPNKFQFAPPPAGSAVDFANVFEPFSLNLIDPNFSVPYAINDNLTIQREFPGQMVLSVGYVGSFGRHLERAFDLNPGINPAACAADPVCVTNRVFQGFVAPQNFRYDPLVFGGLGQQATDGTSHYSSLQVFLRKRISHGLTFDVAYTWSHGIDNGSSFENTSFGVRGTNLALPGLNVGDSGFDARQRFVANYTYEIPVLRSMRSGWMSRVFQGWRVAGITTLQTGFPINISNSDFDSLTCYAFFFYGCPDNAQQLTSAIAKFDPRQVQTLVNARGQTIKNQNFYFAPADFCTARAATCPMKFGQFGNSGRNPFHGPGINVTNLALLKDIKISEGRSFELRMESQNTFNHVSFNNPAGNVNSTTFGVITSDSQGPRIVQLGAKFYF
ncbi:MAG TPA: carboxypeptidase regulatory-like domain-containing protein [Candidatus Acidoferrum sp.]|nr:carboxypeptidase regulatory-like domain-containing protein [Candidatus Acidoferrum sp.]